MQNGRKDKEKFLFQVCIGQVIFCKNEKVAFIPILKLSLLYCLCINLIEFEVGG